MSFAAATQENHLRLVSTEQHSAVTQNSPLADASQFGVRRYFARNETIFETGTPATHVYRVLSGTVRLCRYVASGQRFVLDFVFPSELVGFTNRARHSYDAEAVGDCVVIAYPRAQLDAVIAKTPSMASNILSQMVDISMNAQQHLLSVGCQDAKERIAAFLIRMVDRNGVAENEALYLPMKRRDIADHLALCTETTCRALSALKAQDIISIPDTHQVIIKNLGALRALSSLEGGANGHA